MNASILRVLLGVVGVSVPPAGQGGGVTDVAAARALTAADNGATLRLTGSAGNFTVPKGLPKGFRVEIVQGGAGAATLVAASGVSVNAVNGRQSGGQHALMTLRQVGTDAYIVTGDAVPTN